MFLSMSFLCYGSFVKFPKICRPKSKECCAMYREQVERNHPRQRQRPEEVGYVLVCLVAVKNKAPPPQTTTTATTMVPLNSKISTLNNPHKRNCRRWKNSNVWVCCCQKKKQLPCTKSFAPPMFNDWRNMRVYCFATAFLRPLY